MKKIQSILILALALTAGSCNSDKKTSVNQQLMQQQLRADKKL
jgi:hypothetical protein